MQPPFSPQHFPARYVAMKDSWSHGDDRRDRGRVDRGVRSRRSRSPATRRPEADREPKTRDRGTVKPRPVSDLDDRPRDRSQDRRRILSRSPLRDSREEVRERNRGRELLDTRGSEKPKRGGYQSPVGKRRKTRSPSASRSHHKKSKRANSRSPSRADNGSASARGDKKRRPRSPNPSRRRSPDRHHSHIHSDNKNKHHRESGFSERRGRSRSPKVDRGEPSRAHQSDNKNPNRSSHDSPTRQQKPRDRSPYKRRYSFDQAKDKERKRYQSPNRGRISPEVDRYEPPNRSRQPSPRAPKGPESNRDSSPKRDQGGRASRDEYHSEKAKGKGRPSAASGANSIEVRRPTSSASGANSIEVRRSSITPSGANGIEVRRSSNTASGANSIEVKADKMAGRGFYQGQHGYNPHQQMQAAFPLRAQYQQPQVDPRQYSQSPQHQMTPNSYQSPQQSPYNSGRGNWGSQQQHQQQYSPQGQYQQGGYSPSAGPQGNYYGNQAQSPPYQAPNAHTHHSYQQNFRGNQRAFRGNNQFNARGGRGDHRGGRGGHYQNQNNWNNGQNPGAGRGQHPHSGNVTPQHASPQQQFPPQYQGSPEAASQQPPEEEEDSEDLFRPSKELRVEDKEATKKTDEEQMPPPNRPPPTGPQSQQNPNKFSFAFKASSKPTPTPPKPEISQKLNAVPARRDVQTSPERPRGPSVSRSIPTEPASARRQDAREPPPPAPTTRKVKKIMKRPKPRPQLPEEFKTSDSVYFRKPGNESVVGSGTYGKVFKAINVYTKNLVALKKIRMEGERDGFPVTAVREIKLLQSLKHPTIVNLQEVMVEKNDCFMVFEYLSHDLTGLLNHPTFKLEPAHKKDLAKQLFEGLDYLHRRGVLHRDIKAANILVSNQGQLKLADFGLARFYAKRRQLDYTNRVITIWYRSPELLLGETQYGPAVDIWSAACVLVEIFTRHAIFPGDGGEISQLEKVYAILGTPNKQQWPGLVDMAWFELLRPTARRPNVFEEKYKERVTPAAYELLVNMFQYDPDKRPSASDVLEHPYFTTEEPRPRQAIELSKLEGDWHEFESKALRKENERKDKEARRQAQKEAAVKAEKDKKRGADSEVVEPDPKRVAMGPPALPATRTAEMVQ
ncbi:CTD kinase subunit alpha [Hyphodiscus hymeniophilus]|uniref:cyclin-dependent kinase n=1 Tax=Hyphodiscus hymeniophilus TaxID=353542 RepID=A0A9P6VEM7_9HELO|nr:CTD kinase subunit alpha [Hyphodiscus hymeniophilus]